MRIEFLGGARTVTGSSTLLERGGLKWLVDCGMFQGGKELEKRNWNVNRYHPRELSFILLTHAHIDHSGLIPRLVKEGFQGKVVCTKATCELCEVMLRDSGHIQETEAEWMNRKGKRSGKEETGPLYTVADAEKSLRCFEAVAYDEVISVAEGVKVRFRDAGHILGSAMIEVWVEEEGREGKLVFSGDLGGIGQPIVRDPSVIEEGDVLWLESTYGNRLHKSKEETADELLHIIQEAVRNQAKVVIPAFAIERTQDIIFTLGQFIRTGLIPSVPVYIDSPLAISATRIFQKNSDAFDRETRDLLLSGENPLELPEIVYTRTTEDSKKINEDLRPGIIIASSGMCEAGRIKHHLKHHLWRETSHIVVIGYQAEGTLGRRIVDGAKAVRIFGEEIAVRAHIHTLGGFSAHADQRGLLEWLSHFKNPGLQVFVNHGEEKISLELAALIHRQLQLKAAIPQWREKKLLFADQDLTGLEEVTPGEGGQRDVAPAPAAESFSVILKRLDRNYKRLKRKLKRGEWKEKRPHDPERLRRMEEINEKIAELESELE
jgi:metallo-beta-lactamase family protein